MKSKRSEAIKAREKYYFTKIECKNGHLSRRLTVDGSCTQCRYDYQKKQRASIQKSLMSQ